MNYTLHLKVLIPLLAIILFNISVCGQNSQQPNNTGKMFYITPGIGFAQTYGDVQNSNNLFGKLNGESALGANLIGGVYLNRWFGLQGQIIYAGTKGEEKSADLAFDGSHWSVQAGPTIRLLSLIPKINVPRLNIYAGVALGVSSWDVTIKQKSSDIPIEDLPVSTPHRSNKNSELTIPIILGASYSITDKLSLNIENNQHFYPKANKYDTPDLLDGSPTGSQNDAFNYLSLGVQYRWLIDDNKTDSGSSLNSKVNPDPLMATGDSVTFTLSGNIPPRMMRPASVMHLQPVYYYGNDSLVLDDIIFKGEKTEGNAIAVNTKTGQQFAQQITIPFIPGMEKGELVLNPLLYKSREVASDGMTTNDIKNMYNTTEIAPITVARNISTISHLVIHDEYLAMANMANAKKYGLDTMEYYQKNVLVQQQASFYFPKDRAQVSWDFEVNKAMQTKTLLDSLDAFLMRGWEVVEITIDGWASPEGEESFNEGLSEKRMNQGVKILTQRINKLIKKNQIPGITSINEINIITRAHGEDWSGFLSAIKTSNVPDRQTIESIIMAHANLTQREQEIRNMATVYAEVADEILPRLRRVAFTVTARKPMPTDEELIAQAAEQYNTMDEKALLYAADITPDINAKFFLLKTAAQRFPNNWIAQNNAALAAVSMQNQTLANQYIEQALTLQPSNLLVHNNAGAIKALSQEYNNALAHYHQATQMGFDCRYNQAITEIRLGHYNKALELTQQLNCNHNKGVAQLMLQNNDEAIKTLACAKNSAKTYYMLAVAGVRTNNPTMVLNNLTNAVKSDSTMKEQIKHDPIFSSYLANETFKEIIK